jgi:glycerophosphoryl diester phosphodiesterase
LACQAELVQAQSASRPTTGAIALCAIHVAHRGGEERYTANTRNAFRDAANRGIAFWETDTRVTKDNVWIIMHDASVDATTDGTGAVADLTWAQIAALRTPDDQPVPTLADWINDQSVDRANGFLELKVTPTGKQWDSFIAALTSRAAAGTPRPVLSSFDPALLDQIAARPQLSKYDRALIQSVRDADPATITPHAGILIKHHDAITPDRLARWTAAGLKVYAWADPAADPPKEWDRIAGLGKVSGYVTSSPEAYAARMAKRTC